MECGCEVFRFDVSVLSMLKELDSNYSFMCRWYGWNRRCMLVDGSTARGVPGLCVVPVLMQLRGSVIKTSRSRDRCSGEALKRDRVATNVLLHLCWTPAVKGTAHQWDSHCTRCRKTLDQKARQRYRFGSVSMSNSNNCHNSTWGWLALQPVLDFVMLFQSTRNIAIGIHV